jgi:hypothetical protein
MVIWDGFGSCKGIERRGKAAREQVMGVVVEIGVVVVVVGVVVVGGRRGQSSFHLNIISRKQRLNYCFHS